MQYDGTELKLQPGDLASAMGLIGCTEAHGRTIIEVETAGKGFDTLKHVAFLFEPHIFYKNCPKDDLQEAISQGLAYPHWKGPGSYPKTPALRWAQFQKAVALDESAAISSASWGLGQIMGSEYEEAGYTSPQEMLVAFFRSEKDQVLAMVNLIKHRGLDKALRRFPDMDACRTFAKSYNGAAYEKNNYHVKLHDAYVRWDARLKTGGTQVVPQEQEADSTLRIGDHDETDSGPIHKVQELLKSKGYSIIVDGKFGPGMRAVVLAWKGDQNMATITPDMSPEDVALLIKSEPKVIPAERSEATAKDLKPTSIIVQKTSLGKRLLGWITGGTLFSQAIDTTGVLNQAQSTVDKANQAKGIIVSAKEFIVDSGIGDIFHAVAIYKFEVLVVVAVVGFFLLHQIQQKRVEMHKNAEVA
jgi:hypothetical protein